MLSIRETQGLNTKLVSSDGGRDTSLSLFETSGEESLFDKSFRATPTIESRHEGSANKRDARNSQETRKRSRLSCDKKEKLLPLKNKNTPNVAEENPWSLSWISTFEKRVISANEIVMTSLFDKFEENYEGLRKDVGVHHVKIEDLKSGLKKNTETWKNLSEKVDGIGRSQQVNNNFTQPRAICGECGKNVNKYYLANHQKTKVCKLSSRENKN